MIPDDTERDIAPRHDIESLYAFKLDLLADMERLSALDSQITSAFRSIGGHSPFRLEDRFENHADNRQERYVDRECWRHLVGLFHLERYMLCTDYERMEKEIDGFQTPSFTIKNARAWLAGLKDLINDNVRVLVKKVFEEITQGTYHVGTGYRATRKKRNNNGIDASFILFTYDYSSVFGYYTDRPTVTDDLEKVCYLLAGKPLPEKTAKMQMRAEQVAEFKGEFFSLKFCKNGNTHYTLAEDVRRKLNLYGPSGATIGEEIKIKIVERWAS